ncbi:hypothetical protein ACFCW6_35660 [Streptomyces sp. NPDC056333]|uniref:hypothetical protein n=1 Tax=Streptomyces sp. NPDC056333 TaxID=3345786 RepID=UPI0035DF7CD4
MVSVTRAAHDIEITAESLQEDLARLQVQKQALERELAAVVAHLGSVQRALSALEALMLNPVATGAAGAAAAKRGQAATPVEPQTDSASSGLANATTKSALPAQKPESGNDTERPAADGSDSDGHKKYGRLTEQIMEYFAEVGDADVRARDVAAALGRDSDSGSINGVRSTLDRLVGASRVQRTGRGLYRAKHSQA